MRLSHLLAAALLSTTLAAHADTVYTSAAAYASATGPATTTINFNGIAPAGSYVIEPNPFTLSGSTFSFSPGSSALVIDPGFYGSSYSGGGFLSVDFTTPLDLLTISLPSVTAVSFQYGGIIGTNPFKVTLSDGFTTTFSTTDSIAVTGSLDFLGLTTSSPITSITFALPDTPGYNALDNISYGQAAVTPEPSSFALLGTGLLAMMGVVKRRLAQVG